MRLVTAVCNRDIAAAAAAANDPPPLPSTLPCRFSLPLPLYQARATLGEGRRGAAKTKQGKATVDLVKPFVLFQEWATTVLLQECAMTPT